MINKEELMRKTLELALNGAGFVSPNPLVGAVIVKQDGTIVAEGWHHKYSAIHAEIDAINNARKNGINNFTDMTLVVNLEPCIHFGKQPPCVDAIIAAKIPNVIVGMQDPNPIVAGKGIEALIAAGVNVEVGICEKDCKWINRYFCHYIEKGMPYIIMKVAQTIDGCIATKNGDSKYITNEAARERVHYIRSEVDAILIGINTLLKDNPLLDTRLIDDNTLHQPAVIIIDTNLRTPLDCNIITQNKERKIYIVHNENIDTNEKMVALQNNNNVILVPAPVKNGKIHLRKAISRLTIKYCISSIMVEGGSEIFSSLVASNLINEIQLFIAPIILGDGIRTFTNVLTTNSLDNAVKFKIAAAIPCEEFEHLILIKESLI